MASRVGYHVGCLFDGSIPPMSTAATFLRWVGIERRGADTRPMTRAEIEREFPTIPRDPDRILTVREVAAYLQVHPSTIYRLLREKKIPAWKIGSDWRFNLSLIDKWRFEQK